MAQVTQDQIIFIIGGLIPLIISNVLHMVLVKRNGWKSLCVPIHSAWFGPNKTLRGFVFVTIANGIAYLIVNWPGGWLMSNLSPNHFLYHSLSIGGDIHDLIRICSQFSIGAFYGLFYMLFELPNSWIKRRMGVPSGHSSPTFRWFFTLLDKTDSSMGVSLVFGYLCDFDRLMMLQFFVCASFLHFGISGLLVLSKIKKSF